jgi:hypothetical protein
MTAPELEPEPEPEAPRPIETFTLLTEAAPDVQERYDEWFAHYQPASPGERELLEIAVQSLIDRRRVLAAVNEITNDQIRTAIFRFDNGEEDRVQRCRDMLTTRPDLAMLHLGRSALGCRFAIERLERILKLLSEEGTLYGNDRNEGINLCGARAGADRECLFGSCGAYLVWLFALAAQPAPKDEHFIDLGNHRYMPEELRDRQPDRWFGPPEVCRELLVQVFSRMLADLRAREQVLRTQYEEPARDGAEVREQVLRGPDGMQLNRLANVHLQNYLQAYQAFLRGWSETRKTGAVPGAPSAEVHGPGARKIVPVPATAEAKAAGRQAASQQRGRRKMEAAATAPGRSRAIGAAIFNGDEFRAAMWARAAAESRSTPAPAPPTEAGDSSAAQVTSQ